MYSIHLLISHFLDYKKQEGATSSSIIPGIPMYSIVYVRGVVGSLKECVDVVLSGLNIEQRLRRDKGCRQLF